MSREIALEILESRELEQGCRLGRDRKGFKNLAFKREKSRSFFLRIFGFLRPIFAPRKSILQGFKRVCWI